MTLPYDMVSSFRADIDRMTYALSTLDCLRLHSLRTDTERNRSTHCARGGSYHNLNLKECHSYAAHFAQWERETTLDTAPNAQGSSQGLFLPTPLAAGDRLSALG